MEEVLQEIRSAIMRSKDTSMKPLLETMILPEIACLLKEEYSKHPKVQKEAVGIVSKVAHDSKYTNYVIEQVGVLDRVMTLLQSPKPEVRKEVTTRILIDLGAFSSN